MKVYYFGEVITTEKTKQEMRCKFLERKDYIMRLFGEERSYNIAMLYGELNVLMSVGVYTEEIGEKMKKKLLELL